MPDVGTRVPPTASKATSHTSSQQWQSFEMKMRHRRAERCRLRAEAALEAGLEEEARAAIAEARALDPDAPEFEGLRQVVQERMAIVSSEAQTTQHRKFLAIAAAVVVAAGITFAAWPRPAARDVAAPSDVTSSAAPTGVVATPPRPAAASLPTPVPAPAAPTASQPALDQPVQTSGLEPPRPAAAMPPFNPQLSGAPAAIAPPLPAVSEVSTSPDPRPEAPPPLPETPAATAGADGVVKSLPAVALPEVTSPREPEVRAPERRPVSEEPRVRAVLAQFENAYSSLSAAAAQEVWPSVDARALARAFDNLASQRVSLGNCSISVSGATATADCSGSATWTPKVGGGSRTEARRFQFELATADGAWHIVRATAR